MNTAAPADLQRWSEDVARDRASLAFLPLARAYRRQGRHEAALRLCLKGLASHPHHVAAHGLLALLYAESGDRARAADEWAFVLRLEPDNFDALRGLGFCLLERDELARARTHLEHAARLRPDDPLVRDALGVIQSRAPARAAVATPHLSGGGAATIAAPAAGRGVDPGALFDDLLVTGPLLGVLLLDARGLILAGRLLEASAAELLGAMVNGAIAEADRTVAHLELGPLRGMLMDTADARIHVAAVDDCALLVAARRDAPTGWVLRTAAKAAAGAARFLGGSQ
jgi:tetratricopeptide (TPR) repeat protein